MAIKISNTTAIADDRTSDFGYVNPGSYTAAQLEAKVITGSQGSFTFCSDADGIGALVYWDVASNSWAVPRPAVVSGGTPTGASLGYNYYVFTSPGTLTVSTPGTIEYLIVAGGGGGGTGTGGGGGGGGVLVGEMEVKGPQPVVVGAGATGQPYGVASQNGSDSSIGSVYAIGGGRGISGHPGGNINTASPGGSGGGGGNYSAMNGSAGTGVSGQGNPGAYVTPGGGGGGGAGGTSPGSPANSAGGNGAPYPAYASPIVGPGVPSPLRPAFNAAVTPAGIYGGGGAGAAGPAAASGGTGGGGPTDGRTNAQPGVAHTGGGGGGRWDYGGGPPAGGGGAGIVVVRTQQ